MFTKSKVLVTGRAGFIGSHMADRLIDEGFKVVVVDNLKTGQKENLNPRARFYEVDIRKEELKEVFATEKPEYVFHFAAQINVNHSVEDPEYDADVNIMGALNLLESCVEHKVKKIIFSSTGGALYGEAETVPTPETYPAEPISPYGISKLTVENYLRFYHQQFGLDYAVGRYANVYGPRQNPKGEAGVISIFATMLLNKKAPTIHGDGHQTRDYVYVGDVVDANMMFLQNDVVDMFNVATARQTTVNEIYEVISDILDSSYEAKHVDVFAGQEVSCLSHDKIKEALGWEPKTSIEDGIAKTVEWFVENMGESK